MEVEKISNTLNLNISFMHFNLKYYGEACLQERVVINSTGNITTGRYCGRRYQWSIFVSIAPITLEFHTVESSLSYFELQYQLTHLNLTISMLHYRTYSVFRDIEIKSNILPFSWIHKYVFRNDVYINWNIFVPKMFKLSLNLSKVIHLIKSLSLYDGPDYHSMQYNIATSTAFTSSSFQVSIFYYGSVSDIEISFKGYLIKEAIANYKTYLVKDSFQLVSTDLKCAKRSMVLCAFNFKVNGHFFVNVTLLSFNYSGPSVGYCRYGGLSIYDYSKNDMEEVLLLCNNWLSPSSNLHAKRTIVSTTQSLYLVFYSYFPYSEIKIQLQIQSTSCQGVFLQR